MIQNIPLIGILIIATNVIVSLRGFKDDIFFNKYRFEIQKLHQGEYFRLQNVNKEKMAFIIEELFN